MTSAGIPLGRPDSPPFRGWSCGPVTLLTTWTVAAVGKSNSRQAWAALTRRRNHLSAWLVACGDQGACEGGGGVWRAALGVRRFTSAFRKHDPPKAALKRTHLAREATLAAASKSMAAWLLAGWLMTGPSLIAAQPGEKRWEFQTGGQVLSTPGLGRMGRFMWDRWTGKSMP